MRSYIFPFVLLLSSTSDAANALAQVGPRDARVEALLAQMTLPEKIGEMTQLTLTAISTRDDLDSAKVEEMIVRHHVGSILNVRNAALTTRQWRELITTIQQAAARRRLRIPVLYGIDAVHGHNYNLDATIFPHNLTMAATWDPELVRRVNEITARETRASGIPWNFSPVLDLGREPLWSRFFETFGEDPHLASVMGVAAVTGLQGASVSDPSRVAATGKHFLGYSMPRTGKDRTPAWLPERMLREYFLPPFRAAINAGVRTIMINSGDINWIPVHASRAILTDLLRMELRFDGVAVSDWEDIIRLHTVHRVAATPKEAVRIAIDAGVDMSMVPYDLSFQTHLLDLVRAGSISEQRIDESVRRILKLKFDLGLFDDPTSQRAAGFEVGARESRVLSQTAAEEAITLVKNEGILPLAPNARILLTGPGAHSLAALHGSWTYTWQGTNERVYPRGSWSVLQALLARAGAHRVTYVPGAGFDEEVDIDAAVAAARRVDVAIVVLAERPSAEKPGDIDDLNLPPAQERLARAIEATGVPTVIVLMHNRPRIIRTLVDSARAILLAYHPGPYGGEALAGILYGSVNPSGKLPFTYPRYPHSLTHYDHVYAERIGPDDQHPGYQPQWAFGHGLSYTSFAYDSLTLRKQQLSATDTLVVAVRLTNTGKRAGREVVHVYVSDLYASVAPPVRRLRAFRKIALSPGASDVVRFRIPVADLAFVGTDNRLIIEPGEFEIEVAGLRQRFEVVTR